MKILENFLNKLKSSNDTAKVCKTRMISDRFFQCKVRRPNPNYCEHSFASGGGYICNHKDRELFARK